MQQHLGQCIGFSDGALPKLRPQVVARMPVIIVPLSRINKVGEIISQVFAKKKKNRYMYLLFYPCY